MRRPAAATLAAAAALLLASAPPGHAQGGALAAYVDSLVAASAREEPLAGLSVVVVVGRDTVVRRAYGSASFSPRVAATPSSLYHVGSIGKQFTAAAIVRLAGEGKLRLDQPLTDFVPAYTAAGGVTLRHLLTHTSGIPDYTEPAIASRMAPPWSREAVVAALQASPPEFAPGERFRYSNSNYFLLGMVVEKASGRALGDDLRDTFFRPLGMTGTRWCGSSVAPEGGARGEARFETTFAAVEPYGFDWAFGAGDVCSTAPDLARWTRALAEGRAVPRAAYARMTTPARLTSGAPTQYGFGLEIDSVAGHRRVAHGGHIRGFTSRVAHYPDDALTIVLLSNTDKAASVRILERRIALHVLGAADPAPAATDADRARVAGIYDMAADTVRRTLRVYERDGRLMMKITGRPELELAYLGGDAWALRVDPQYRFDFVLEGGRATGFVYRERGTRFAGTRREGPPPGYADLPLAPGEGARLARRYALGSTPLEIIESAGHLALRAADPQPLRLLKQGDGRFVLEADPEVVLRFTVTGAVVTLAYTQQGRTLTGTKAP